MKTLELPEMYPDFCIAGNDVIGGFIGGSDSHFTDEEKFGVVVGVVVAVVRTGTTCCCCC